MSSRNFEARLADNTFKKDDVRIIHKSDKVPPPPLAYSKKIPIEDREKIKSAVLEAHKYGEVGGMVEKCLITYQLKTQIMMS